MAGWLAITEDGAKEVPQKLALTLLDKIIMGDLELNTNNQIEISESLVQKLLILARSFSVLNLSPIGFTEEALLLKAFVEDTIALGPPDRNYRWSQRQCRFRRLQRDMQASIKQLWTI